MSIFVSPVRKRWFAGGMVTGTFFLESEDLMFNMGGLEMFQKRRLYKEGMKKNRGDCDSQ